MVTKYILWINLACFIILACFGGPLRDSMALFPESSLNYGIWQYITHQFLHAGLIHLGFNMLALYSFGQLVEEKLGALKYAALYLMAGIGGGLLHNFISTSSIPMVGASGAIYGILAATALIVPNLRVLFILFPFFPIKICYLFGLAFVVEIGFAFFGSGTMIAHWAHIGGAAFGFLLTLAFLLFTKTNRMEVSYEN